LRFQEEKQKTKFTCILVQLIKQQIIACSLIHAEHNLQMTTPEIATLVKDILLAIAAIITPSIAFVGLKNWNRELRGKAAFEVAVGLTKATYKLRDEIKSCRAPMIRADEFPDGLQPSVWNKDPQTKAQAYLHVYAARWQPVQAALHEFDTQTLGAEALWGAAIRQKTDELRACVRELSAAIDADIANTASGDQHFSTDQGDFGRKMRATVHASMSDTKNKFSLSVETAVSRIESELRPQLRRG
jgi:hypothetical protein